MFVGDGRHPLDRQFRVGVYFGIPLDFHIVLVIYLAFELLVALFSLSPLRLLLPIVLIGSVYLHELGHSLMSAFFGNRPRRIVLHLFGGVAEIPPYLSTREQLWVIAAGPLVSGALTFLGFFLWLFLGWVPIVGRIGFYFFFINFVLFLFNVLPIYPLDGGQFVRQWFTLKWGKNQAIRRTLPWSMALLIILALLGMVFNFLGMFAFVIALFLLFINYQEYNRWQHLFIGPKGFWGELTPSFKGGMFGGVGDRFYVWFYKDQATELMRRVDEEGIQSLSLKERKLLEKYLDAKMRLRDMRIGPN